MTTLETMAKSMFQKYALKTTGRSADWSRLSKKRKQEWLEEALLISDHVVQQLKAKYGKPLQHPKPQTSYEGGYYAGVSSERIKILNFFQDISDELKDDLEEFKEK